MTSQKSTQAANVTTAADELNRFARFLEYRTRDLRETVATFLVGNNNAATTSRGRSEENDDGLFDDDVDVPGGDWVEVIDNAKNADEDRSLQIYYRPKTPPPGAIEQTGLAAQRAIEQTGLAAQRAIEQTGLATQRAALQARGLTGTYLEHGLRLVAEDVGWLTHTASFEDAVQKVQKRFPLLKMLGESYGKGARKESQRRRSEANPRPRLLEWNGGDAFGAAAPPTRGAAGRYRRLRDEELREFAEVGEVPVLREESEEWDPMLGGF